MNERVGEDLKRLRGLRKKFFVILRVGQGLKPGDGFAAFTARVNSRPDTKLESEFSVIPGLKSETGGTRRKKKSAGKIQKDS
jgi:hypothetical protein